VSNQVFDLFHFLNETTKYSLSIFDLLKLTPFGKTSWSTTFTHFKNTGCFMNGKWNWRPSHPPTPVTQNPHPRSHQLPHLDYLSHLIQKLLKRLINKFQLSLLRAGNTKIVAWILLDNSQSTPIIVRFTRVVWWPETSSSQCKTFWKHLLSRISILRRVLLVLFWPFVN